MRFPIQQQSQMQMNNNQMIAQLKRQMVQNPQQFAQNALRSGKFSGNEFMTGALQAVANNDISAMQTIAGNVCKEHNVSVEDAQRQYRQYYGLG